MHSKLCCAVRVRAAILFGQLPVLEIDGKTTLYQSKAIALFLAKEFGMRVPSRPRLDRARPCLATYFCTALTWPRTLHSQFSYSALPFTSQFPRSRFDISPLCISLILVLHNQMIYMYMQIECCSLLLSHAHFRYSTNSIPCVCMCLCVCLPLEIILYRSKLSAIH